MVDVPLKAWMFSVEAVVDILKTRFPNLTTTDTIKLANELVRAVATIVEQA